MARSGHFSVATAVALVLAGVCALWLAAAITLGGYGRGYGRRDRATAPSAALGSPPASGSSAEGGAPAHELEYLIDAPDTSD
jgi:hypothetical protein